MANITRYDPLGLGTWDPFGGTDMMTDMLRELTRPTRGMGGGGQTQMMPFRMDVNERQDAYIVHADLPGVRKEDIHVSIEGNQVTIDAEVRPPEAGGHGMQGGMAGGQGQTMQAGEAASGMGAGQGTAGGTAPGSSGAGATQAGAGNAGTSGAQAAGSAAAGGSTTQGSMQDTQAGGQGMGSQMMAGQGGQMQAQQGGGMRNLRSERYVGRIYRSFVLPDEVDADQARARFDNGVLTLTLPKIQHAAGRQLNIE